MSENVEVVRRSFERIREGRPAWELYAEDFQLVNLPDAPWQPSPGHKGLQEWLDFSNDVAEEWGADLVEMEALDSERVLMIATWWGRFRATGIRDEISSAQVYTLADRKITRVESYPHARAGPRSRRAVGVGDVGGLVRATPVRPEPAERRPAMSQTLLQ